MTRRKLWCPKHLVPWCNGEHFGLWIQESEFKSRRDLLKTYTILRFAFFFAIIYFQLNMFSVWIKLKSNKITVLEQMAKNVLLTDLRWPGIEPRSTAWKATMLTITPSTPPHDKFVWLDIGKQICYIYSNEWNLYTSSSIGKVKKHFFSEIKYNLFVTNSKWLFSVDEGLQKRSKSVKYYYLGNRILISNGTTLTLISDCC